MCVQDNVESLQPIRFKLQDIYSYLNKQVQRTILITLAI